MADVREILVDWTTISGSGKVSVFHFLSGIAVASQRTALNAFLTTVKASLDSSAVYTIRGDGRELDVVTGALTGSWSETSSKTGAGGGGGEPVNDAAQALIRWKCATIINGRFLQGRTFIPGVASSNEENGDLKASAATAFQGAANTFIASAAGVGVWHRPVLGSGGFLDAVSTATVWNEFAVLRRRRK